MCYNDYSDNLLACECVIMTAVIFTHTEMCYNYYSDTLLTLKCVIMITMTIYLHGNVL